MILSFINIRKVPREALKTEGEWKIMFDPYIINLYYSLDLPKFCIDSFAA